VESPRELARVIGNMEPGTKTEIGLWRDGETKTVSVTLGELPAPERTAMAGPGSPSSPDVLDSFGLTVTPAEDGKGLVVTDVDPASDAAERGIKVGDVIVAVNAREVNSAREMEEAVKAASESGRKAILLQIERDSTNRYVALPVAQGGSDGGRLRAAAAGRSARRGRQSIAAAAGGSSAAVSPRMDLRPFCILPYKQCP